MKYFGKVLINWSFNNYTKTIYANEKYLDAMHNPDLIGKKSRNRNVFAEKFNVKNISIAIWRY